MAVLSLPYAPAIGRDPAAAAFTGAAGTVLAVLGPFPSEATARAAVQDLKDTTPADVTLGTIAWIATHETEEIPLVTLIADGPFRLGHVTAVNHKVATMAKAVAALIGEAGGIGGVVAVPANVGAASEVLLMGLRAADPGVEVHLSGGGGPLLIGETLYEEGAALALFTQPPRLPDMTPTGDGHGDSAFESQRVFYQTIIEEMTDGVSLINADGVSLYESPANQGVHGWAAEDLIGVNFLHSIVHPDDLQDVVDKWLWLVRHPGEHMASEIRVKTKGGDWVCVQANIRNCLHLPQVRAMVNTFKDISDLKRAQARLLQMATIDDLTGAMRRDHFLEVAGDEIHRARRHDRPLSVMLFDLDYFKAINDTFGHAVGDDVLRAVGAICRETKRRDEAFGRLGGEEFAILLPEADIDGAIKAVERLKRAFANAKVDSLPADRQVTASFGLAQLDDVEHDIDAVLARADIALYRAKADGRDRWALAPPLTTEVERERDEV